MNNSQSWIEALGSLRADNTPCAMVVVTAVEGSAPREVGARMLIAAGELHWGTIGGGNLEHLAIQKCLQLLASERPGSRSQSYPLAEKTGQCCGGRVTLFFEAFPWQRPTIAIFGAGHVGQALANLAPWLEANVLLIDGRHESEIKPAIEAARPYELLCIDAPEAEVDTLAANSLVLIMTHNHDLDQTILERALKRDCFPYLGLIGSGRKWKRFQQRLSAKDFDENQLAEVHCPIGLSQASKSPAAIALSTATQLMEVLKQIAPT
jgi:xanthine dehydrogenase accessory factor